MCWVVIVVVSYAYATCALERPCGGPGGSSPRPSPACSRPDRGRRRPGRLCAAAAAPAWRNRSSDGAPPARTASASVGRERRVGDRGQADAGAADAARAAEPERRPPRRPWRSRRPGARASGRRPPAPAAGVGRRTSVRTSVGSMAVVKVSRKKSRAGIDALAASGCGRRSWRRCASRTAGQSEAGSAWAHGAADRAPVADLRVADVGGRRRG